MVYCIYIVIVIFIVISSWMLPYVQFLYYIFLHKEYCIKPLNCMTDLQ